MAESLHTFLVTLIRTEHPLLPAIVSFNTRLAQRVVRVEEGGALAQVARAVLPAQSVFAAQRLEAVLPLLLGKSAMPWVLDFRQPWRRIGLLPPEQLTQLAHWYGLAALRQEVSTLIGKQAVEALQQTVGEGGRLFAIRRAELLTGKQVLIPDDPQGRGCSLPERIWRAGKQAIQACLAGVDTGERSEDDGMPVGQALSHRLNAVLSSDLLTPVPQGTLPPVLTVWPVVRKLVIKEIAPSWTPCFT